MRSAHNPSPKSQDDNRRAPAVADAGWSERTLRGTPKPAVSPRPASPAPAAPRSGSGRPRSVPFAVLIVGVLAAGMCALLALNTATAASEVRQRRVDAANASLSARQEQLSRSVAEMQAPAELSRLAARLGLVPAGSAAFLRINADGTVTVLGAPTKVPAPVIPLTPAEQAAAKAALNNAAAAKAAQAKATKAGQAKATKAKATASTKTKPSRAASPTAPSTGIAPPKATAPRTTAAKTTSPKTASPKTTSAKTTSPKTTSPKTASPKTVSPTPTVTKPSPVPTVTVPGGPR